MFHALSLPFPHNATSPFFYITRLSRASHYSFFVFFRPGIRKQAAITDTGSRIKSAPCFVFPSAAGLLPAFIFQPYCRAHTKRKEGDPARRDRAAAAGAACPGIARFLSAVFAALTALAVAARTSALAVAGTAFSSAFGVDGVRNGDGGITHGRFRFRERENRIKIQPVIAVVAAAVDANNDFISFVHAEREVLKIEYAAIFFRRLIFFPNPVKRPFSCVCRPRRARFPKPPNHNTATASYFRFERGFPQKP